MAKYPIYQLLYFSFVHKVVLEIIDQQCKYGLRVVINVTDV